MGKTNRKEKTFRDSDDQYYEYNRPKKNKDQKRNRPSIWEIDIDDWDLMFQKPEYGGIEDGKRVRS